MVVHPGGSEGVAIGPPTLGGVGPRSAEERYTLLPQVAQANIASLIYDGIFTRFPRLKVVFAGFGFLAGPELIVLVHLGLRFGAWVGLAAGIALGVWLGWKIAQRSAVTRAAQVPRIGPDDLRSRLDSDDPPVVVDLRGDITRGGESVPGAYPVAPRDLPGWAEGVPRDKEIVVACD